MTVLGLDPRKPPADRVIRTDSDHDFHMDLRKTLVLLSLSTEPIIYMVFAGLAVWNEDINEANSSSQYYYEQHTCPINLVGAEVIAQAGDLDPHGVFDFVDMVWMTDEYVNAKSAGKRDEYLVEVFPELRGR